MNMRGSRAIRRTAIAFYIDEFTIAMLTEGTCLFCFDVDVSSCTS